MKRNGRRRLKKKLPFLSVIVILRRRWTRQWVPIRESSKLHVLKFLSILSLLLFVFSFQLHASDAIWSDTISVSVGPDVCRNPVIAVTGDTTWVAWETDRNGNWDIYAHSYVAGKWSPYVQMTESDSSDLSPVFVRDRFGKMWFVWESKQSGLWKIYARPFDGWAMTEEYPSPENTVGSLNPDAVVDRFNRLWVVWQSPGSAALDSADVYIKYFDGVTWTEPFNVTDHPADDGFPKVAVDSTGNVWVVWQSDRSGHDDIFTTFFDGHTWLDSPLHVASGPSGDFTPQMTVDSRGRVWFAWMSNFNIFARFYDENLSAVFQLTVGYYVHHSPQIVGDASSNLWVIWSKEEEFDNLYARYYDGESWSASDTAAALGGSDRSPSLAVDWMDNLWQVWDNEGNILLRMANIPPSPPLTGFEPSGGVEIQNQRPLIQWNAADEPVWLMHYVIQIDDSHFEDGADFQYVTEDGITSFEVQDSLADNTHWDYRIQTVDPTELSSAWSETQDFYIDLFDEPPFPPKGLTLEGLIDGEVKTKTPTFLWSFGGDNDPRDVSSGTRYLLQIDDELSWMDPVQEISTLPGDTTVTTEPLEENQYYFARIQAVVTGEELPSEWSDTISFRINTENSTPTVRVLRPNGGEVWSGTQSIMWSATDPDDDPSTLTVTIDLSSNTGRSWEILSETDAEGNSMDINDGVYFWGISSHLRGRDFLVRVTATDPHGLPSSDSSDAPFVVSSMRLDCQPRLFSPNGDGFNDEVTISFDLVEDSDVTVQIYDLAGRLVRLLKQDHRIAFPDGQNFVRWDGKDEDGHVVPNRLYIVTTIITDSHGTDTRTKTVVVLNQ